MENLGSILISAILSGVFATIITLWWQNKSHIKQEKVKIFTTLMSKRYEISSEESVDALNMIDVIFYTSPKVRTAWKQFQDAANSPDSPTKAQVINDKHLKLLEMMAEEIGYRNIRWDDIKEYYYPVGLSERKRDEAVLRKVQIDASLAQINKQDQGDENARVDSKTEMSNQMLLKALENPEGFIKLIEAAGKAQNLAKGQRKK